MVTHVRNLLGMQWLGQKFTSIFQGDFEHFYNPFADSNGLNDKIMAIKRKACGYRNGVTSKPPSISSAADWTSIRPASGGANNGKLKEEFIGC